MKSFRRLKSLFRANLGKGGSESVSSGNQNAVLPAWIASEIKSAMAKVSTTKANNSKTALWVFHNNTLADKAARTWNLTDRLPSCCSHVT